MGQWPRKLYLLTAYNSRKESRLIGKAAVFTLETIMRGHTSSSDVSTSLYVPCIYLPRKQQWCFCRPALSGLCTMEFDKLNIATRSTALLFLPLPQAWLLPHICAPSLPCTSNVICAAAQGASLGSCLQKNSPEKDSGGVVAGREQASWYWLGEDLLKLLLLLTSVWWCLVIIDSTCKTKVFEKDKTIC